MPARRVCGLLLVAAVVLAALAFETQANRMGAPANAAVTGCTCHARSAVPAKLNVVGLPNEYKPGEKIQFRLNVTGGPPALPDDVPSITSRGGFAIAFQPSVGDVKAAEEGLEIQDKGAGNWTHTRPDVREWNLSWTPPSQGVGEVKMHVAVNAVNGDATNNGDSWVKEIFTLKGPVGSGNRSGTTTPPPSATDSPGPLAPLALLAVVASAVVIARRRPRA